MLDEVLIIGRKKKNHYSGRRGWGGGGGSLLTSQILLIETRLRRTGAVRSGGPEAAAVRGQDFVYEDDVVGGRVEAELEFGVGDYDAEGEGVFVGLFGEREEGGVGS